MEITFGIYDQAVKDAKAIIADGKIQEIKLLIKAPRRFYYSLLNDASKTFEELYPQYL